MDKVFDGRGVPITAQRFEERMGLCRIPKWTTTYSAQLVSASTIPTRIDKQAHFILFSGPLLSRAKT